MTTDKIEELVESQVRFWRYDKNEDVYMNCWTVSNHGSFGFFPNGTYKPEYNSKQEAQEAFRNHLRKSIKTEQEGNKI